MNTLQQLLLLLPLAAVFAQDDPSKRLNPNAEYVISNARPGFEKRGFIGEYFELSTPPIVSRYSEVVWDVLPSVQLPQDIVNRFDGKIIAITGHEVNVVRKNEDGTETSVPCYESYNHHYVSYIRGKGSDAEIVRDFEHPSDAKPLRNSHGTFVNFTRNKLAPESGAFTAQAFSEHNGNEARQTYHGLPVAPDGRAYAVPIASPVSFLFGPMQINTRNPKGPDRCRDTDCPLPRSSNAPPNASWSGLLECPCTTRVVKTFGGHFAQSTAPSCPHVVTNASECFEGVSVLLAGATGGNSSAIRFDTVSGSDAQVFPAGCAVAKASSSNDDEYYAYVATFNDAKTSHTSCMLPDAEHARRVGKDASLSFVTLAMEIDAGADKVRFTITAQNVEDDWYAIGFNASTMLGTYAIVVDGNASVSEHVLGDHNAGKVLSPSPSLSVLSRSSDGSSRTIVLERALTGTSPEHMNFSALTAEMPYIAAVGSTETLSQHRVRGTSEILLLSPNATCVCRGGTGTINGFPFDPQCMDEPKSDLLKQHNPTCNINTYSGGMSCCRGGVFLLDEDQAIPEEVDEIYYVWRFYYQPWNASTHKKTYHIEWQFGHIEYDVPKAPIGTPPEDAVHTLTTRFTVLDLLTMGNANAGGEGMNLTNTSRSIELVMAGFHCHSPACLGGELYNADTGEMLCRVVPTAGGSDRPMDESSYLWLPPCQWGDPKSGLAPPPVLSMQTNLLSIKRANSTYGHYGVMAIWQGRAAFADGD